MTHDELLAEIDIQLLHLPSYFNAGDKTIAGMKALRAVVELCNFLDKKGHCCVPVKEVIQAIEKELK